MWDKQQLMADNMTQDPKPARPKPATAADQIDANLKRVYDDLLHEEVPARFTDLLAQLKEAGAQRREPGAQDDS